MLPTEFTFHKSALKVNDDLARSKGSSHSGGSDRSSQEIGIPKVSKKIQNLKRKAIQSID